MRWAFSGRDMKEREAAIATLRRHRAGVEGEGFDREDDFVIRHRVLVTDRQAAVRAFPLSVLIQNVASCHCEALMTIRRQGIPTLR